MAVVIVLNLVIYFGQQVQSSLDVKDSSTHGARGLDSVSQRSLGSFIREVGLHIGRVLHMCNQTNENPLRVWHTAEQQTLGRRDA